MTEKRATNQCATKQTQTKQRRKNLVKKGSEKKGHGNMEGIDTCGREEIQGVKKTAKAWAKEKQ